MLSLDEKIARAKAVLAELYKQKRREYRRGYERKYMRQYNKRPDVKVKNKLRKAGMSGEQIRKEMAARPVEESL